MQFFNQLFSKEYQQEKTRKFVEQKIFLSERSVKFDEIRIENVEVSRDTANIDKCLNRSLITQGISEFQILVEYTQTNPNSTYLTSH